MAAGEGTVVGDLGKELRLLCRGRGVLAPDLPEIVGPMLRARAGIGPGGSPVEFRRQLVAFLDAASADLPEDLRLAFSAGLALHESRPSRFLTERMKRLATQLDRVSEDTARAYLDDAIAAVEAVLRAPGRDREAQQACLGPPAEGDGASRRPDGWHLAALRVVLDLTGPRPAAFEDRTVVADRDLLAEITVSTAIPRRGQAGTAPSRVDLKVRYGGTLTQSEWLSASYLRYVVRLSHALRRDEEHDVGVILTIPAGQPFCPRYVFTPLLRCDEFDLLLRFGPRETGCPVWRIPGLPPGLADDFADPAELVCPDDLGDVNLRFDRPQPGLSYGARWAD